jgi:hypothetical protein
MIYDEASQSISLVGSERIELSIFAMSRQRHKPLDHEP